MTPRYCLGVAVPRQVDILYEPSQHEGAKDVFVKVFTGHPGSRPEALVPHIDVPMLVLWGDADVWTPINGKVTRGNWDPRLLETAIQSAPLLTPCFQQGSATLRYKKVQQPWCIPLFLSIILGLIHKDHICIGLLLFPLVLWEMKISGLTSTAR